MTFISWNQKSKHSEKYICRGLPYVDKYDKYHVIWNATDQELQWHIVPPVPFETVLIIPSFGGYRIARRPSVTT